LSYHVTVRYGGMGNREVFTSRVEDLKGDEQVIVRTQRGVEHARTLTAVEECDEESMPQTAGEVLRRTNETDARKIERIEETLQPEEMSCCQEMIARHKLPMKLVSAEHLFGGNKIIFYFRADNRVDFRALVKDLAHRYQRRIELRQIGVRDEARLTADYEHCGRELCCRTFMKNLEPVTMRMAKNQKATLDPAKISGRCGRLMCCLRYEYDVYEDMRRKLPKKGVKVQTPMGSGVVKGQEVLAQSLVVDVEGRGLATIPISEISVQKRPAKEEPKAEPAAKDAAKPAPQPAEQQAPAATGGADKPAQEAKTGAQTEKRRRRRRRRPPRRGRRRK